MGNRIEDNEFNRRHAIRVGSAIAAMATITSSFSQSVAAETGDTIMNSKAISDATKIVGTWDMTTWRAELPNGEVVHPLGEDAVGTISYSADGRMSFMMMRHARPLFESGDPLVGTDDEIKAAYAGFMAYSGRYTLDSENKHMTHFLDICWFPNWVGSELTRAYAIDGDRLVLSTVVDGGTTSGLSAARQVLEWKRA